MDGGSLWFLKITSLLSPFVPVSHVSKDLQRYQSNQLAQKSQGEPATSCQTEMEEAGGGGGAAGMVLKSVWPALHCSKPHREQAALRPMKGKAGLG